MDKPELKFMEEAIKLAEEGRFSVSPNPMVGCVIVKEGSVVGRGSHLKAGMPHAEIIALKKPKRELGFGCICHTRALLPPRSNRSLYRGSKKPE